MGTVLTGSGGAFTAAAQDAVNQGFTQIQADFYVDAQYGFDGNPGTSPGLAFRTPGPLAAAMTQFRRLSQQPITVAIAGVLTYEWDAPMICDVTLVGAGNQPRQATTGGIPNGGGATWLSPATGASTHLLTINAQGWTVKNLYFNNSTASMADILLMISGTGDPPLAPSAEQTLITDCTFTGAKYGVRSSGGPNWVTLSHNLFFGFSDSGDTAVSSVTGAGVHSCYGWQILNNRFASNAIHIGAALNGAEIAGNRFTYLDNLITTTTQISLSGGLNNAVHNNYFDINYGLAGVAFGAMFVLGTADKWYFNEFATAVSTTIYSFGQPSS